MKKTSEAEKIEVQEEKQEAPKVEMTEIRPGLWRKRAGAEVREVMEYRGVFRATVTHNSATRVVGDYATVQEACAAFEEEHVPERSEAPEQTGDESA